VHPEKDPGCRLHGHELLRIHQSNYNYAMMLFDREGSGGESKSRDELESDAERTLAGAGWKNRSAVIVLNPEIDIWVWSDSPVVDEILGWSGKKPALREWLQNQKFELKSGIKPTRPKEALEAALRVVRKSRSSSYYKDIALRVSFDRCVDPAFGKFLAKLREWFGPTT